MPGVISLDWHYFSPAGDQNASELALKGDTGSARVPWGLSKRTLTGRYGNLWILIAESLFCPPQRHLCDDDGANDVCEKHSSHI